MPLSSRAFFWFLQNITHWLCIFAIHPAKLCKMRKQKRNCGNKNDLTLIKKPLSAAATTTTKYAWKYRAQQNLSLPAGAWKAAHFLHFCSRARQSHTHIYVCYLSVCQSLSMSMSMCVCVCVWAPFLCAPPSDGCCESLAKSDEKLWNLSFISSTALRSALHSHLMAEFASEIYEHGHIYM